MYSSQIHSTTILALSFKGSVVFAGDGQVTLGNSVVKHGATKVRSMRDGSVLAGFAGSAADSFTLFERFEGKLQEYNGLLTRAAVELAKEWRSDRYLRRLEAMMIVGDKSSLFLLSGSGDVIQPDDGILAIGSGGNFALAAARGLVRGEEARGESSESTSDLTARRIAELAMNIAAEICPFTNSNLQIEEIIE